MQGMNFTQIYHRIADVLWDTQVAQWSFVSSFSAAKCNLDYRTLPHVIIDRNSK